MQQKTIFAATSNRVEYESGHINYIIEFKEGYNVLVNERIYDGLQTNYYYGTYTQSDSIIILYSDQPELNISNRFLIRTVNVNGFSESELVQVDENGKEVKNQFQFIIDSYGRFETNRKNDSRAESSLTPGILGKWLVVNATIIPFDHISFCKNLSINSVFEFNGDRTLKVMDSSTGNYCNLELTQYYSVKGNKLRITEYDMIFDYQVNLLTQDSLILRINNIPQRYITETSEFDKLRAEEEKEISKNGILVTLTRIKDDSSEP